MNSNRWFEGIFYPNHHCRRKSKQQVEPLLAYLLLVCFLLGLFSYTEDGDNIFCETSVYFLLNTQHYLEENINLHNRN
jgi:hypothetical protein